MPDNLSKLSIERLALMQRMVRAELARGETRIRTNTLCTLTELALLLAEVQHERINVNQDGGLLRPRSLQGPKCICIHPKEACPVHDYTWLVAEEEGRKLR